MIQEIYCKELKDNLKYHAAWLPNDRFELGDYGTVKNNLFTRIGNVDEFDIVIEKKQNANIKLHHASTGITTVQTDLNASVVNSHAALKINFLKQNSVVFFTSGSSKSVSNYLELQNKILELLKDKQWDSDHYVITELLVSNFTTAIISSDKNASIELEATDPTIRSLDLANLDVKLNVKSQRSINTQIVADGKTTPLFRLSGASKSVFGRLTGGKPDFTMKMMESFQAMPEENYTFNQLSYD